MYFVNTGRLSSIELNRGSMGVGVFGLPDPDRGRGGGQSGQSIRFAELDMGDGKYDVGYLITQSTPDGVRYLWKSKEDGSITELGRKSLWRVVHRGGGDRRMIKNSEKELEPPNRIRTALLEDREDKKRAAPHADHPKNDTMPIRQVQDSGDSGAEGGGGGGTGGSWYTLAICNADGSDGTIQVWYKPSA